VVAVKERLDRQLIDDGVLVPERVAALPLRLHGGRCLCRRISLTSGQDAKATTFLEDQKAAAFAEKFEAVASPSHTASSLRARRLKAMKSRQVQRHALAISLLVAPVVLAQEMAPAGSEAPPGDGPAGGGRCGRQLPRPRSRASVSPALDARLKAVETKLAGTEETVGALQSTVDGLKKDQGRRLCPGSLRVPPGRTGRHVQVHRARTASTCATATSGQVRGKNAEYFLQIDAQQQRRRGLRTPRPHFVYTWERPFICA